MGSSPTGGTSSSLPNRVRPPKLLAPAPPRCLDHSACRPWSALSGSAGDRRAGVLRVHAVHEDEPFPTAVRAGVEAGAEALAHWLGLDLRLPG